jgi:hypothetical protein
MQELALKIIKPFVAAMLFLTLLFIARQVGYSDGHAAAVSEYQQADIKALNKSISDLKVATKDAGALNLQLHEQISKRQQADAQASRAFKDALKTTASQRAHCNFDRDIMQQLTTSADRADKAASSGITKPMPSSRSP